MAGKVVNLSLVHLIKFGAIRQEIASKSATSHIRKTLAVICTRRFNRKLKNHYYEN